MNERKKRTYEVNEAKGNSLIIEQGRGRGCGGQKKVLLPGGQERCVCGVCLEKMKKKMPCKRAQQFFPLCSGIVEQELTLHMPSGPLLTQNRGKVKKKMRRKPAVPVRRKIWTKGIIAVRTQGTISVNSAEMTKKISALEFSYN